RHKTVKAVWFNPWEHEKHEEPMVELLNEIRYYFTSLLKSTEWVKKISTVSIQAGLELLKSLKKLPIAASDIQKSYEKYEYDNFDYVIRSQRFKVVFQEAIKKLLAIKDESTHDKARLVIFIDDLDRCDNVTIAKLLKEIKQYLSTKRCVFVFGFDRHQVEKAVNSEISLSTKETRSYLEKIFQTTIYIKQPIENKVVEFAENLFDKLFNGIDIKDIDKQGFIRFIASIVDTNPRRIKSFLVGFYLHYTNINLTDIKGESTKSGQKIYEGLALITYLKVFHEPVYSVLENMPSLVTPLIESMGYPSVNQVKDNNDYFFYLELRSHLRDTDEKDYKFAKEEENKFLSEIYEMQGRHKSHSKFKKEFIEYFQGIAGDEFQYYL
ncbi:MAG: KAP family NTPase, partial [Candidatus Magnetoovum sp. WYHC-5]|nr:KAP family NTPase [Candidatus Magnetoovum sp. WYHC-5]